MATSLPPQCGGVPITNWDWDAVEREESASGTTWGEWHVVGTYADGALTLTEPPGPPRRSPREAPDFSPACDEPDVVDPNTGEGAWMVATAIRERYAGRLCVVERDLPTETELRRVQEEVVDEAARAVIGQVQSASADHQRGAVVAQVWVVDGAAERDVRDRWGDRVVLDPLLWPVPSG